MLLSLQEWQNTFKQPKDLIVQASAMNGSDSWQTFPIGMCHQYGLNYDKNERIQIGSHSKTVLACFNEGTDNKRRKRNIVNRNTITETLLKNGIIRQSLGHFEYFDSLPDFKFVISPEGNGIDCHRHYEALIAGCIPVVEHNKLVEEKYKGCPILYTTDYSEINEEYLQKKYDEMKNEVYDFSRLFLSFYSEQEQAMIKKNGNFWMKKHKKNIWY
jgi:hypothetical protein